MAAVADDDSLRIGSGTLRATAARAAEHRETGEAMADAATTQDGQPLAGRRPPFRRLSYVVGHSRGGTTWLGALLGCHPGVRYVFEPFASQAHPCTGIDMQTVFNGGRLIHRSKRGRPVPDVPIPRFFRGPADDASAGLLPALAATHLAEVARHHFPDAQGYHLVVKQPRIENLAWAADALDVDDVIALDRHPFGVVNSVRRWGMLNWTRLEWRILTDDPALPTETRRLADAAGTPEERLLVLTWLRSRHLRDYVATHPHATLVDYETLCLDPIGETTRLWHVIGLTVDADADAALVSLLASRSDGEDARSRFLNVFKDPLSRQHAWRRELPESIRLRLEGFVREHALAIPLPGAGLPPLTAAERWLARQADLFCIGERCRRTLGHLTGIDRSRAA